MKKGSWVRINDGQGQGSGIDSLYKGPIVTGWYPLSLVSFSILHALFTISFILRFADF